MCATVAPLHRLSASEAASRYRAGTLAPSAYVDACLARIDERDRDVHAWAHVASGAARAQAKALDGTAMRGALHGLPVGVKDVLDTFDMPTRYGSRRYADHVPPRDSACVAALRAAGAVLLGKTVSTEFASPVPAGVRNPRDLSRTAGVSSSGSAAAVADGMVPLALGTQTGGSVVRPASYCGVYGFKPSIDAIDRSGLRHLRPSLDTIGLFARTLPDIVLLDGALRRTHAHAANAGRGDVGATGNADPARSNRPAGGADQAVGAGRASLPNDVRSADAARTARGLVGAGDLAAHGNALRIGVCRTADWPRARPEMQQAFVSAATRLQAAGAQVADVELPPPFDRAADAFRVIVVRETAASLAHELREDAATMNAWLRDTARAAASIDDEACAKAQAVARQCRDRLAEVFERFDVLIAPAAAGEAPQDLASPDDPTFSPLWTLMHGPVLAMPAFTGPHGLPMGLQIIGRIGGDARLLAVSHRIGDVLGVA